METPQIDPEPLLGYDEVAALLKTTPRHVRHLRVSKGLPTVKLGGLVRFRWSEVEAWLDERRQVVS